MRNRDARVAGALYLLAILVGFVTLRYLPDVLIQSGDAPGTAHKLVEHQFLLRLAIVGDFVAGVVWLFVVLALNRLLKGVDRTQANLMVILGAFMQVPLYFVNAMNYVAALLLVSDPTLLRALSIAERSALAMLFLKLHYYELLASLLFGGLWLFPFGALVLKSRFLPRLLGAWLLLDGFAWLTICLCGFLTPQYSKAVGNLTSPFLLGEIAIALWLLIMGAGTFGRPEAMPRVSSS
jgi:hypothetical protein